MGNMHSGTEKPHCPMPHPGEARQDRDKIVQADAQRAFKVELLQLHGNGKVAQGNLQALSGGSVLGVAPGLDIVSRLGVGFFPRPRHSM